MRLTFALCALAATLAACTTTPTTPYKGADAAAIRFANHSRNERAGYVWIRTWVHAANCSGGVQFFPELSDTLERGLAQTTIFAALEPNKERSLWFRESYTTMQGPHVCDSIVTFTPAANQRYVGMFTAEGDVCKVSILKDVNGKLTPDDTVRVRTPHIPPNAIEPHCE